MKASCTCFTYPPQSSLFADLDAPVPLLRVIAVRWVLGLKTWNHTNENKQRLDPIVREAMTSLTITYVLCIVISHLFGSFSYIYLSHYCIISSRSKIGLYGANRIKMGCCSHGQDHPGVPVPQALE